MKKLLTLALLVLVLTGTVLAVLALRRQLSWTYALIAFGAAAILATVQLGWQLYGFWRSLRENDKTVRNRE